MRRFSSLFLLALFVANGASSNPISPAGLIPEAGPFGSFASFFDPDALPGVDGAAAADYLRPDGRRIGAMLAASTTPSYDAELVTAAFAEGAIRGRSSRVMAGGMFDVLGVYLADGREVFAIGFIIHADGERMMIDGHAPYSLPANSEAMHVVALAETEEAAALLIAASLELIASAQPLGFVVESPEPAAAQKPSVFPNPFAGSCQVGVELTTAASIDLAVFDALGRRVAILASATLKAGAHQFPLDAFGIPPGVYVVRLAVNGSISSRRITRM